MLRRFFFLLLLPFLVASLPAQAPKIEPLSSITHERVQQELLIQATLINHREPWNDRAPHLMTVSDGGNQMDIVFWNDIWDKLENKEAYKEGAIIQAYIKVDEYRNQLQLKLGDAKHMRVVGTASSMPAATSAPATTPTTPTAGSAEMATAMPIAQVTAAMKGQLVAVRGKAISVNIAEPGSRRPTQVTLEDASGSIMVVFWEDLAAKIEVGDQPIQDSVYEVAGEVGEHRGNMQIRLRNAGDFRLAQPGQPSRLVTPISGSPTAAAAATPAPPVEAPAPMVTISSAPFIPDPPPPVFSSATSTPVADPPTTGTFPGADPFGNGMIPNPVATPNPTPVPESFNPFATMSSTPVETPAPIATPAPTPAPVVIAAPVISKPVETARPSTAIGDITLARKGETVEINGRIERAVSASYGLLMTVGDGTGSLSVFVPIEIVEKRAGLADVVAGNMIRLRGTVQVYKNKAEVFPASPADILEIGRTIE